MGIELLEEEKVVTAHYPQFKVIMHNDPKTPMDLVVFILIDIYKMELGKAVTVMLEIHNAGQGLAGVYSLELAELKVEQTHSLARGRGYPLTCTIEKA